MLNNFGIAYIYVLLYSNNLLSYGSTGILIINSLIYLVPDIDISYNDVTIVIYIVLVCIYIDYYFFNFTGKYKEIFDATTS